MTVPTEVLQGPTVVADRLGADRNDVEEIARHAG